jgi:hypothetical protein
MLTEDEAEKLKRKLARERAQDLEKLERESRGRRAALDCASREQRARSKERAQRMGAAAAAKAAGKEPKPAKRSVYAVSAGAFETNRRKF